MTVRAIPILLQSDLEQSGSTFSYLLKMRWSDGTVIGVTSDAVDFDFDDGAGIVTYLSHIGLTKSAQQSSGDLSVDNAEAKMLYLESSPFTEEQVNHGVLDSGRFNLYRVNYKRPTRGYYNEMAGVIGHIESLDGLGAAVELRGISQRLKQTVVELVSKTCRATFGSTGRFGCFFDAESLWAADDVASVDALEPDRIFTVTNTPSATGPNGALPMVPGLIKFKSGKNAGLVGEIEEINGKQILLRLPAGSDFAATDTFDIRPDCDKRYDESCIALFDNKPFFRGEPRVIPGDEVSAMMPGGRAPVFHRRTTPESIP